MNHSIRWISLVLAASCCVGCVSAQVDFEDIQVTRQNIEFPGVPEANTTPVSPETVEALRAEYVTTTLSEDFALPPQRFSYSDALTQLPEGVQTSMTIKQVVVAPHDHIGNLSFLHKLLLTVTAPDVNGGEPRVILDYSLDNSTEARDGALIVPIVRSELTIDPWKMRSSVYELSVWGGLEELPQEIWAVDVTLTLSGTVEYDY